VDINEDNLYDIGSILTSAFSSGIGGFLIGYAIKKGIKIIMTITGLFLTSLAYLNYQGLINVDWGKVVSVTIRL
jgi:uncharacterized membrane protein (Fun14 family)